MSGREGRERGRERGRVREREEKGREREEKEREGGGGGRERKRVRGRRDKIGRRGGSFIFKSHRVKTHCLSEDVEIVSRSCDIVEVSWIGGQITIKYFILNLR